jgi:hypothetical protein
MEGNYQSRAETAIAAMLRQYSMSFRYEHPMAVMDRGRLRLWYPDFLLPEQGVIIEYNGLPEKPECRERQEHKRLVFAEMGLPALFLEPPDLHGQYAERVLNWMESVQEKRLGKMRQAQNMVRRSF